MKTVKVNVYSFSELSAKAREKAVDNYATSGEQYHWGDDVIKSLKGFIEHFGGVLDNYEIDFMEPGRNVYRIEWPEQPAKAELRKLILSMGTYNKETLKGTGECKFTGTWSDDEPCDGARIAFLRDGEQDIKEIIRAGIKTWEQAVQQDCEHQFSEEGYKDLCEANGWLFTEDGKRFYLKTVNK